MNDQTTTAGSSIDGGASALTAGLENMPKPLYPRAHRYLVEVVDGHRIIHGRPHGFSYKPLWTVEVQFDSEAEAEQFFASLRDSGIGGRPVWTIGS